MKITKKAYEKIRKHCRKNNEKESCGYMFGGKTIKEVKIGKNMDDAPYTYTIDPESTFDSVFRKDFKGVFHSHLGAPNFSGIDLAKKKYPDKYYSIYSVAQDVMKTFFWNGNKFIEEKVEVI